MNHPEYFINAADSIDRCPCSKCGALPVVARRSSGGWVAACPFCDLGLSFDSVNPRWFRQTKNDAIYIWSGRQLAQRVFCGALMEVAE
ncbi:MAG: hypothetical protein ACI4UF_03855 [Thermoguttaceae bacterium]